MENLSFNLFSSVIELLVPEGTEKEITVGDTKLKIVKKDGKFELEASNFDDSEIKNEIKDFKKAVKDLDDDLFVDFLEYFGDIVKINEFSKLLDQPKFCEHEADCASTLMHMFSDSFEKFMNDQIGWMKNQRDHFLNLIG